MAQAEWRPLVWLEAVIGPYCLASNHDKAMHFKYCVWVGCTSIIMIIVILTRPTDGKAWRAGLWGQGAVRAVTFWGVLDVSALKISDLCPNIHRVNLRTKGRCQTMGRGSKGGSKVPNFLVKITIQLCLLQTSRNVLKHVIHKWGGHIWPFHDALRPQRL